MKIAIFTLILVAATVWAGYANTPRNVAPVDWVGDPAQCPGKGEYM